MDNKMFELAEQLRGLRAEKDDTERTLKEINGEIDKVEYQLSEIMAETETQNFTRGGKQFILTTTTRWSAETGRKENLYAALKENGYDHLFTVNPQTLSSFIKEQVTEAADAEDPCDDEPRVPAWLDGLVKSYDKTGITMKSVKKY